MIEGLRSVRGRCGSWCVSAVAATVLSGLFASSAHAALAAPELLASGSILGGSQSFQAALDVSGPGRLTVRAYDLGVPSTLISPLSNLSFSVANSTSVFGAHNESGTMAINVSAAGIYSFVVNMQANQAARFQLGLVSWYATFEANAPVPLPASVWLLIAGLAWATGMQRRRAKLPRESFCRNQSVTYGT